MDFRQQKIEEEKRINEYLFKKYKDTIDFELLKEISTRDTYKKLVNEFLRFNQSVPKFIHFMENERKSYLLKFKKDKEVIKMQKSLFE